MSGTDILPLWLEQRPLPTADSLQWLPSSTHKPPCTTCGGFAQVTAGDSPKPYCLDCGITAQLEGDQDG